VNRMVSEGNKRGTLHKGAVKKNFLLQEVMYREHYSCLDMCKMDDSQKDKTLVFTQCRSVAKSIGCFQQGLFVCLSTQ